MKILEHLDITSKSKISIPEKRRVIGIDPSSKHMAFSIMQGYKKRIKLEAVGKINFPENSPMGRCKIIDAVMPELVKFYKPNILLVEESIWIQNPQTSRVLAYTVGSLMQAGMHEKLIVGDVAPLVWKPYVGYKNVTKKEMQTWSLDDKETKKRAAFERKNRVATIMWDRFPGLDIISDTDILDSVGISLWGVERYE